MPTPQKSRNRHYSRVNSGIYRVLSQLRTQFWYLNSILTPIYTFLPVRQERNTLYRKFFYHPVCTELKNSWIFARLWYLKHLDSHLDSRFKKSACSLTLLGASTFSKTTFWGCLPMPPCNQMYVHLLVLSIESACITVPCQLRLSHYIFWDF